MKLNKQFFTYLSPALFLGLGAAFFNPLQSTFFISGKGVSPDLVGIYLASSTAVALIVSQIVGYYSDKGLDRKLIIQVTSLFGVLGFGLMGVLESVVSLMLVGITFVCLSTSGSPQVFAIAKERYVGDSDFLMAAMRAAISLSWVFAPPLAFFLGATYGYEFACFLTSAMYGVVFLLSIFLPKLSTTKQRVLESTSTAAPHRSYHFAVLAIGLLYMAVNNYIMIMPVYLTDTLGYEKWVAGALFGVTAALEIPVILLTVRLAKYISFHAQLVVASACGLLYFGLFELATGSLSFLLPLQLLNALAIAFSATSGLQIMQMAMPTRIGYASTVYSNTIALGMAAGALLGGQIASKYGYSTSISMNAVLCFGSFIGSWFVWVASRDFVDNTKVTN